jgi:MerR family transcriptional regulator, light-induced transcriptional regulator
MKPPRFSPQALLPALAERYLVAQLAGDRRAALRIILEEALACGVSVPDLYLKVLQPAQHQIGRLWEESRIGVAEEHLATAITELVLAHLYPSLPRAPDNGQRALIACVAGERHDMGARITADFFEMAGFGVRFLGADVPTESLVAMAREDPPDLLVLSTTMTFNVPALREAVLRARDAVGDRLHLGAGGHALAWAPGLGQQLGVEISGDDVVVMVTSAQRLLLGVEAP